MECDLYAFRSLNKEFKPTRIQPLFSYKITGELTSFLKRPPNIIDNANSIKKDRLLDCPTYRTLYSWKKKLLSLICDVTSKVMSTHNGITETPLETKF